MKKSHWLTALITGVALATLLVGCGSKGSASSSSAQTLNLTEELDPTTLDVICAILTRTIFFQKFKKA